MPLHSSRRRAQYHVLTPSTRPLRGRLRPNGGEVQRACDTARAVRGERAKRSRTMNGPCTLPFIPSELEATPSTRSLRGRLRPNGSKVQRADDTARAVRGERAKRSRTMNGPCTLPFIPSTRLRTGLRQSSGRTEVVRPRL